MSSRLLPAKRMRKIVSHWDREEIARRLAEESMWMLLPAISSYPEQMERSDRHSVQAIGIEKKLTLRYPFLDYEKCDKQDKVNWRVEGF